MTYAELKKKYADQSNGYEGEFYSWEREILSRIGQRIKDDEEAYAMFLHILRLAED